MKKIQLLMGVMILAAFAAAGCGKKKDDAAAKPQAKIAYAIYGVGVFDTTDAAKASEWLNRGEMVTVHDTVTVPNAKDPSKSKSWAKIERTTGKVGFVDPANIEPKAFVVISPLEVFNINQASGKRLATVPVGQVGFVVEEKAEWAKVRFGYKINEQWSFAKESQKWVDQKWTQLATGVSYDAKAIGEGVELEAALRKFNDADAAKKAAGKKELETIISDGKSQFIEVAQQALAAAVEAKPADGSPAEDHGPPGGTP